MNPKGNPESLRRQSKRQCPHCERMLRAGALHHHVKHAHPTPEEIHRSFWSRVDKAAPNGCWVWTGYCQRFGHGWLGKKGLAHRYAWTLLRGPLPTGKCLLHHCDNPPCVNPEHLFIGDRRINGNDAKAKLRTTIGERNKWALLTDQQAAEVKVKFKRYSSRRTNARELAAEYGVSKAVVLNIAKGQTYRTAQ